MTAVNEESPEQLRLKLNRETGKIPWAELQRFYAQGLAVGVAPGVDLIEMACHFAQDNQTAVAAALEQGQLFKVDDARALQWAQCDALMWAVVVAPWVMVQQVDDATSQ